MTGRWRVAWAIAAVAILASAPPAAPAAEGVDAWRLERTLLGDRVPRRVGFIDGGRRLWVAIDQGILVYALDGPGDPVSIDARGMVQAHAGATVVVADAGERTASVWDAATGVRRCVLPDHGNWVWGSELSPDGSAVATACPDGTLRVCDLPAGTLRFVARAELGSIGHPGFTADSSGLVVRSGTAAVQLLDARTGAVVRDFGPRQAGWVRDAVLLRERGQVLATSADGTVAIWDLADGALVASIRSGSGQATRVFAIDRRWVLLNCARDSYGLDVIDADAGAVVARIPSAGGQAYAADAALTPDGRRLVVRWYDGDQHHAPVEDSLRVYDVATWTEAAVLVRDESVVGFALDGARGDVVAALGSGAIAGFAIDGYAPAARVPAGEPARFHQVAIAPDGGVIAVLSSERAGVQLWRRR